MTSWLTTYSLDAYYIMSAKYDEIYNRIKESKDPIDSMLNRKKLNIISRDLYQVSVLEAKSNYLG